MKLRFLIVFCLIVFFSFSQNNEMQSKASNFNSFSESKIENLDDWKELNDQSYWTNPDFGTLPKDAPCTNCIEILAKRKEDERFFVDINDRTIVYQQKSLGALHYFENNNWRRIDARIKPSGSGIYASTQQIDPTYINTNEGYTSINTPFGSYNFNNWKLYGISDGEKSFLSEANWTNKTIGDDGMIVFNYFPGIDLKLEVFRGRIKSSFVVHHNYYQNYTTLYFQDEVTLKNGQVPILHFEDGTSNGRQISEITVKQGLIDALYINQAIVFPEGNEKNHSFVEYDLSGNKFGIYIPKTMIQNSLNLGKNFIIDPTVTSTNTLAQASITGSGYNATCFNGFCSYNLSVPTPANATITNVQWSFVYRAYSPCFMSEGANTFFLGTCRSPGQNNLFWYCNQAATGTCTGNAISIFSDVSSCLPPPSCAPQNLNFTMRFHRCYSSGAGCSNACIGADSPWTMTITGKTLEYTNATAITLSATTICAGQSITASTASSFGVPGYTYNWSLSSSMSPSVGSTSSVTIPFPTAGTYTIYNTVTDQCGIVINSSRNITVNASPIVTSNPNPQTICSGQGVGVALTSSMSTTSYSWTVVQSGVTGASNGSGNGTGGSSTYNLNQTLTNSGSTPGTATYTITPTESGCTGAPITLVVTVNPIPTVTNPGSQTICAGQNTNAINFTGTTGATFNWSNNNTTTGLGASGSGNIASFIGLNTGTTNNVSNVSVTPSFGSCNGTAQNFSITVTPLPTVNTVTSQTVCAGQSTTAITFTGNATSYSWSNNNTAIGLGASGTGNIASFTSTNTTVNPITATISVTPTSGTCQGTPTTFTITVNPGVPTPTITTAPPTCSAVGTATVSNYDGTFSYTFTPNGPTVGAGGAISGMTVGTSYTVIAGNGSCSSAASASFSIAAQLTIPSIPSTSVVTPTCSANGSASVTNYDGTLTYTFTPLGPTVGAGGAISGMTAGTNYTVTAGNGSCTSAPSTSFSIAGQLATPAVPTIATAPATCSSNGTATITNYNATLTYTFSPTGPIVGASGAISGMNVGTSYSVIAGDGSCNSAASSNFSITAQLTTPAAPTITVVPPTCTSAGSASVSNYDASLTYSFSPSGPTVGAGGTILGMTNGTNYTVTAGNGGCTSIASNSFSIAAQLTTPAVPTITTAPATCTGNGTAIITNYNANLTYTFSPSGPTAGASGAISGMTVGTSYTVIAGNGSCSSAASASFSIAPQLSAPPVPTTSVVAPTCSTNGSASVTNYDGALTYTFTPSGPTIGAGGAISGMTAGTNYTVTAGNGSCTSAPSTSFSIAAQLTTPVVPTITTTPATCTGNGTATISNYNASLTYTFSPTGPTAGAGGAISGMTIGISYTVIAGNGSCSSAASASFSISAQLATPSVPTTSVVAPTCLANGSASLSNYDGTLTYTFTPSGPTVGAGGAISGMTLGTNYTVTAGNGSCTSAPSTSFSIAAQLTTPAIPTIITTPATCSSNGTATISNYNASLTYTFSPTGPTAGAGGAISGMTVGTNYTLTAGNGSCTSALSNSFSIDAPIPFPSIPFQVDNALGCSPLTATLSAVNLPNIQYQWSSNGSVIGSGATLTSVFSVAGCYDIQLTISNSQGCTATSSESNFICVESNPIAAFTPNPSVFSSNSQNVVFTNSSTGAETYFWDFGDFSTSTEVNPSHVYSNIEGGIVVTLVATSALGCTDEATFVIGYQEETIFYVPNTFTPDQDEFNQTWGPIFTQGFDPFNFDLYIFNRWGEVIWESHDASKKWDGTYGVKGLDCPDGVYTWKLSYKPKETDEKISVSGSLNLIR